MDHLSSIDASFLHLETPETPMHVGSLMLLELPGGQQGDFHEAFNAHHSNAAATELVPNEPGKTSTKRKLVAAIQTEAPYEIAIRWNARGQIAATRPLPAFPTG